MGKSLNEILNDLWKKEEEEQERRAEAFLDWLFGKIEKGANKSMQDESMTKIDIHDDDIEALAAVGKIFVDLLGMQAIWGVAALLESAREDEEVVISFKIGDPGEEPYDPMAAVAEWHKAVGEKPFIERDEEDRKKLLALRRDLLLEEVKEVVDEIELFLKGDPSASIARLMAELGDVLYITYGTAEVMERYLPAVFQAIHRKNLEKINPETGEPYVVLPNGKVGKPEGFEPLTEADIEEIIN